MPLGCLISPPKARMETSEAPTVAIASRNTENHSVEKPSAAMTMSTSFTRGSPAYNGG